MFKSTPAIAGFATGVIACVMLASATVAVFNGHGFGDPPRNQGEVIYPNW